ncbi:MAG: gliding motility protein GldM [Paludibacter sp.]|nr:gliding motility protein GldM [Paludibacter sp.]
MGGAKNCPETPRQKMIGMMYLVLTAMLALNVSSEILNGFTMVDNSLHATIESSDIRNKALYDDFQYQYEQNPTKVQEWLDKAKFVKQQSDDLYDYIEKFKVDIVKIADKDKADPKARNIEARDNLDAAGRYAILGGKGKELKNKIDQYSSVLVTLSNNDPEKQKMYKNIFSTDKIYSQHTNEKVDWNIALFEMMPVSAVVTILTKYQSDIRGSESEMIQYLKSQTDASDYRVNKIEALVIPNSKFVFKGEKYSAKIVLSAVDSTKKPEYFVGGRQLGENGVYEFVAGNKLGSAKYSGEIRMKGNDGTVKSYKFEQEYMVGEPSATISNEDLNVVYKGIDNKISVSVPGVAPENVHINVVGGSYQDLGKGRYIVRTTKDGEIKVNVFGKVDKKDMSMGAATFRVKRLPPPSVFLLDSRGDENEGMMTLDDLRGASLVASYGPDALVPAKFNIVSFTMIVEGLAPLPVSGQKLDLGFLNKLSKGKNLLISNIKAVGPDRNVQSLGAIVVRVM